jgi:hypothetical protein
MGVKKRGLDRSLHNIKEVLAVRNAMMETSLTLLPAEEDAQEDVEVRETMDMVADSLPLERVHDDDDVQGHYTKFYDVGAFGNQQIAQSYAQYECGYYGGRYVYIYNTGWYQGQYGFYAHCTY